MSLVRDYEVYYKTKIEGEIQRGKLMIKRVVNEGIAKDIAITRLEEISDSSKDIEIIDVLFWDEYYKD
jgi:hypothetical protein